MFSESFVKSWWIFSIKTDHHFVILGLSLCWTQVYNDTSPTFQWSRMVLDHRLLLQPLQQFRTISTRASSILINSTLAPPSTFILHSMLNFSWKRDNKIWFSDSSTKCILGMRFSVFSSSVKYKEQVPRVREFSAVRVTSSQVFLLLLTYLW